MQGTILRGRLPTEGSLQGRLSGENNLSGALSGEMRKNEYKGPYEVEADLYEDQTLATKDKTCTEDITVKKVEYAETSNPAGGLTVYIGK